MDVAARSRKYEYKSKIEVKLTFDFQSRIYFGRH